MLIKLKNSVAANMRLLPLLLSIQFFVVTSFVVISHSAECCHTKVKSDYCCARAEEIAETHCLTNNPIAETITPYCGCFHTAAKNLDAFTTQEKISQSNITFSTLVGYDDYLIESYVKDVDYQLKFLSNTIPKYLFNSLFLI
ncbi:MAG: hypothetical protein A2V66_02365 [Ignavibacteria bacterium RBG_13_36_8]|nr:MAG: hypothetical protein A2V66_02365 [Ignavibacteria bacterium RBG_13_36_8]